MDIHPLRLLLITIPSFASNPQLSLWASHISNTPWNVIHSLPCKKPCKILSSTWYFFVPGPLCPSIKQNGTVSGFSTNPIICISRVQGPSTSSVKMPLKCDEQIKQDFLESNCSEKKNFGSCFGAGLWLCPSLITDLRRSFHKLYESYWPWPIKAWEWWLVNAIIMKILENFKEIERWLCWGADRVFGLSRVDLY
jgi:hypothetical protein